MSKLSSVYIFKNYIMIPIISGSLIVITSLLVKYIKCRMYIYKRNKTIEPFNLNFAYFQTPSNTFPNI